MWPEYKFSETNRELFFMRGGYIYDEHGESYHAKCWNDICSFVIANNALTFVGDMLFNHIHDAVADRQCKVVCNAQGIPTFIRVRRGREVRWLVGGSVWKSVPDTDFLYNLRSYFDRCGVGVAISPSSLGMKMMRYDHQVNSRSRHTSLSLGAEDYLRKNSTGPGVQTPGLHNAYDEALQLDLHAAYLKTFGVVPDGAASWFSSGRVSSFATYFAECRVTLRSDLPMGLFPLKQDNATKTLWPTLGGVYEPVFLWKEQVDLLLSKGCKVDVHSGYGWTKFTADTLSWCELGERLRQGAKEAFDEKISKVVSLAPIGKFGMSRERYFLCPWDDERMGRPLVSKYGEVLPYFVEQEIDRSTACMIHWHKYAIMLCNVIVQLEAWQYAEQGRLIAVDYDSILILEKGEKKVYVKRHSIEALQQPPGTWLWEELREVLITNHRAYTAIDAVGRKKIKAPGVQRLHEVKQLVLTM